MNCPDCATPVEYSGRGVLVDLEGSGMRRHFCPAAAPEREVWDSCLECGGLWIRIGGGPRLDMATRQPHACPKVEPETPPRMPEPPRPTIKEGNGTVPGHVPTIAPRHRVIEL